jgi:hypothetical protein
MPSWSSFPWCLSPAAAVGEVTRAPGWGTRSPNAPWLLTPCGARGQAGVAAVPRLDLNPTSRTVSKFPEVAAWLEGKSHRRSRYGGRLVALGDRPQGSPPGTIRWRPSKESVSSTRNRVAAGTGTPGPGTPPRTPQHFPRPTVARRAAGIAACADVHRARVYCPARGQRQAGPNSAYASQPNRSGMVEGV